MDDFRDQPERVLGAQAEPDEGHIRMLPRRHRAHFFDVDLARDDLVAEAGDNLGEQLEPVPPFVRDQNAEGRHVYAVHGLRSRKTRWKGV